MTKQLLDAAFVKAEQLTGKESVNGRAVYLAELVSEDYRYPITAKSMARYFLGESTPKKEVLDALAQFLGYGNYEDFVSKENVQPREVKTRPQEKPGPRRQKGKRLPLLVLALVLVLGSGSYYAFMNNKKDCILWVEDHYEAVPCSGAALEQPYKQHLLENFRKLKVSDTTEFFRNGQPRIWYDKSDKQLEYFSAPGLHPINGKTLKPISRYMIDKYL